MSSSPAVSPIPQPPALPLIGHRAEIDGRAPIQSLLRLQQKMGPVFGLTFPGRTLTLVSSREAVADACDLSRFDKHIHPPLKHIRDFAGDALFTAHTDEPNWAKAHRLLAPAFGPPAMRSYFDDMHEVADQMLTKWERLGPDEVLEVPDNMTRLTLDTIALCGFGYRFNSFYQREMHPFVDAMVRSLEEAGRRSRRLPIQTRLMRSAQRAYDADIQLMGTLCDDLIARRKRLPPEAAPRDLLGLMLGAKDPVTGEGLDDVNIRHQLITFLIAGHETTSGLLSFALHQMLENPAVLERAHAEVDRVLGDRAPRFEDMPHLSYLDQILRETLRLHPTAPAFAVHALQDTLLAGRYPVKKDAEILVLLPALHRDPAVWSNPERFDPERFAPGRRETIPDHAWMPFGAGQRACIGRSFAMQEATLVLAMMLQRFELESPAPYQLRIRETLTLKPEGLRLRARPRLPASRRATPAPQPRVATPAQPTVATHGTPLLVAYGSNSGASEAFARRIASDGSARGYAVQVATLDERTENLPTAGAVVIVSASYNGQPPDNARRFVRWLSTAQSGELAGVRFAVFGCGHRDWEATYQAIPTQIDAAMEAAGAERLLDRGAADARADFFGDFDAWYAPLWDAIGAKLGVTASTVSTSALYEVQVVPSPSVELVQRHRLQTAKVLENRELVDTSSPLGRSKRHLEIALPEGLTYAAGDYLAVLPENHPELVERAARRFGLRTDSAVVLHSTRGASAASLPLDRPVSVAELLGRQVELSAIATRADLEKLAAHNRCPPHRAHLDALAKDPARYQQEVQSKRTSVLDLLEAFPSIELSLGELLEMLPAMRVRQYSISSSPRVDPKRCSLTVAVVEAPAWSGHGQFHGVASSYLARLRADDTMAVAVRTPNVPFHPPESNATPMLLIGAGTGLAPLRGFLQDRAQRRAQGEDAGPALLFFGCDHPEVDFLYREEIAQWEREGVVAAFPAFFKQPDGEVTFVQHRLWKERARVQELLDRGAVTFLCGDGQRMAPAVRQTLARIHQETAGGSLDEAQIWLRGLEESGRFVADVFS